MPTERGILWETIFSDGCEDKFKKNKFPFLIPVT
jgi:hypothetical protein